MLLCLLPLACGAQDSTIDIVFDPCSPIQLTIVDATTQEAAAVEEAVTMWQSVTPTGLVVAAEATNEQPVLPVRFEAAAPMFYGIYRDERGDIVINHSLEYGYGVVIAHELGHAMGLDHISGRTSVMNEANRDAPPNAEDAALLQSLWGSCSLQATDLAAYTH